MGGLRTSEDADDVVGGEARQAKSDDDRKVDAPGRIIIDSAPIVATPAPTRPAPTPLPQPLPAAPSRGGGLGLVIVVYVLAAAALGAAIYERFYM